MIPTESAITSVAHVIELAVAPAFVLTGIGSMLGVMTARLSRVIDRAREVEAPGFNGAVGAGGIDQEIKILSRRARLIGLSIGLCTLAALLIASVIAALFLGAFVSFNAPVTVASLFIAAMLSMVAALLLFLREVFLATASLRIGTG